MTTKKPRLRLPTVLQEHEEVTEIIVSVSPARACTYCGHMYVFPCDGNQECANRIWLDSREVLSGHDVTTHKVQAKNL
jgi:hypothetical protein